MQQLPAVPVKPQDSPAGTAAELGRVMVGAAPCCALSPAAFHSPQPGSSATAVRFVKKGGFTLLLALSSLPFSRTVFRLGVLESTGSVQKLCSALGFISRSRVRPVPRATGNLILTFFRCCGFRGRSGRACPGVSSVVVVLPRKPSFL